MRRMGVSWSGLTPSAPNEILKTGQPNSQKETSMTLLTYPFIVVDVRARVLGFVGTDEDVSWTESGLVTQFQSQYRRVEIRSLNSLISILTGSPMKNHAASRLPPSCFDLTYRLEDRNWLSDIVRNNAIASEQNA